MSIKVYSPEAARALLRGEVDAVCREANGDVAWEIHQHNLITDAGLRHLVGLTWTQAIIFTSPSVEPGDVARSNLFDSGLTSTSQASGTNPFTGTYDAVTLTRTWNYTFATPPAQNRRIGTIGLMFQAITGVGPRCILAYTLISPTKTQSPTQTLEVLYRITFTPIY